MVGREVEIRGLERRDGLLEVCIAHPDGGALLVPGWATDLEGPSCLMNGCTDGALFRADLLLKTIEKIDFIRALVVEPQESCGEASDARGYKHKPDPSSGRPISHGQADDAHGSVGDADDRARGKLRGGRP